MVALSQHVFPSSPSPPPPDKFYREHPNKFPCSQPGFEVTQHLPSLVPSAAPMIMPPPASPFRHAAPVVMPSMVPSQHVPTLAPPPLALTEVPGRHPSSIPLFSPMVLPSTDPLQGVPTVTPPALVEIPSAMPTEAPVHPPSSVSTMAPRTVSTMATSIVPTEAPPPCLSWRHQFSCQPRRPPSVTIMAPIIVPAVAPPPVPTVVPPISTATPFLETLHTKFHPQSKYPPNGRPLSPTSVCWDPSRTRTG
jgi:hypothetical protein